MKILLAVSAQMTGLNYHRQLMPHAVLKEVYGHDIHQVKGRMYEGKALAPDITGVEKLDYDIAVFNRQIAYDIPFIDKTLEICKKNGAKVVLDVDDFWCLPDTHGLRDEYNKIGVSEKIAYTLRHVDHVTTTTEKLAGRVRQYNPNVTILPNSINPRDPNFQIRPVDSPLTRFGWIGGRYHLPDILPLQKDFRELYNASNAGFQICLGGFNTEPETQRIEQIFTNDYEIFADDIDYFNYLRCFMPFMEHISYFKKYRRLWARDVKEYGQMYNEIDVALVPLEQNTFNSCKSELKIIEAGWMKKAVICSPVDPYLPHLVPDKNCLTAKRGEWSGAILRLTRDRGLREELANNLHEYVKENFNMLKVNETRNKLYQCLVSESQVTTGQTI